MVSKSLIYINHKHIFLLVPSASAFSVSNYCVRPMYFLEVNNTFRFPVPLPGTRNFLCVSLSHRHFVPSMLPEAAQKRSRDDQNLRRNQKSSTKFIAFRHYGFANLKISHIVVVCLNKHMIETVDFPNFFILANPQTPTTNKSDFKNESSNLKLMREQWVTRINVKESTGNPTGR